MKIIYIILIAITLNAQVFTKNNILGVWEVSSLKHNGFTSFGSEFSRSRGETYTLVFNKKAKVKNQTTNTIYNYEIANGKLKIYKSKKYKYGNVIKDKRHYDLFKINSSYENCFKVKIIKKKIPGYYKRAGYKWCKVQEYPKAVKIINYNFK